MVAPASVANASAQVDSFDLADSLAIERGSAFAGSSAASGGGSMNRRSSGSAATLDRAVSAVMTVSLAAAGCQLDAEGAVCVIPTGVPAVSASGPGAAGSSTRNGLLSGTSLAKGGRARQPGLAASVAIAPPQAQRRLSAAAQSSATVSVSVASDAATGAGDAPSSSKAAEAPAAVELILDAATRAQATRVFASRALLDSLTLVERAVQQNQYHDAHRRYRGGPAIDVVEGLLAAGKPVDVGGGRRRRSLTCSPFPVQARPEVTLLRPRFWRKQSAGQLLLAAAAMPAAAAPPQPQNQQRASLLLLALPLLPRACLSAGLLRHLLVEAGGTSAPARSTSTVRERSSVFRGGVSRLEVFRPPPRQAGSMARSRKAKKTRRRRTTWTTTTMLAEVGRFGGGEHSYA